MEQKKCFTRFRKKVLEDYKRVVAFLLAVAMVITNMAVNINVAYAAETNSYTNAIFRLSGKDIRELSKEAVLAGKSELGVLEFTSDFKKKYEKLFHNDGNLYEIFPDLNGEIPDGAQLRVFVRAKSELEEVLFLYINRTDKTIRFNVDIDGAVSKGVMVPAESESDSNADPDYKEPVEISGDQIPETQPEMQPETQQEPADVYLPLSMSRNQVPVVAQSADDDYLEDVELVDESTASLSDANSKNPVSERLKGKAYGAVLFQGHGMAAAFVVKAKDIMSVSDDTQLMPAQVLVAPIRGTELGEIMVEASEGTLPEGAYVEAAIEEVPAVQEAMERQMDGKERLLKDFALYDVAIFNKEGVQIEPEGEVSVTFSHIGFSQEELDGYEIEVYHVEEKNSGLLKIQQPMEAGYDFSIMNDSSYQFQGDSDAVSFQTTHFSLYAVVGEGEMKGDNYEMHVGERITIYAEKPGWIYSWSVGDEDEEIVSLSNKTKESVEVLALNEGTVTLKYSKNLSSTSQKFEIKVLPQKVESISISGPEEVVQGSSIRLTTATDPQEAFVAWSSANKDIASVDSKGNVTGNSEGTVVIKASAGNKIATHVVTVYKNYKINFHGNGGKGMVPETCFIKSSESVTLPENPFKKDGMVFAGWGLSREMKYPLFESGYRFNPIEVQGNKAESEITLYANWASENASAIFFVRMDGIIPVEPGNYLTTQYSKGIQVANALKVAKPICNDDSAVLENLKNQPMDIQIKAVAGSYNKDTQYVKWYVIKMEETWHVDGVILDKNKYNVTYSPACTNYIGNAPAGLQHVAEENVEVHGSYYDGANGRNPLIRSGYTFGGWINTSLSESKTLYQIGDTFAMPEADVEFTAKWIPNSNTKFTVEHYRQNKDESWPEEPFESGESFGTTGSTVRDDNYKKDYPGYEYKVGLQDLVTESEISENGTTVLKLYYVPYRYTVTYTPGSQGAFSLQTVQGLIYGEPTPEFSGEMESNRNPLGKKGYTFKNWSPNVASVVTGNVTYVAIWEANSNTPYNVKIYYQKDGEYPSTANHVKTYYGTTDNTVWVEKDDKVPRRPGYVLDISKNQNFYGTVTGDGELVLQVYFKQQFTVVYEPGDHGTFAGQTHGELDYGIVRPEFEGTPAGKAGYTFIGWSPDPEDTVTADKTYTAQWKADLDTKYTVSYFYEKNGSYSDQAESSKPYTGETDTMAVVGASDKIPQKQGYAFDDSRSESLQGIISGDGELVLKVYFKQQFTVAFEKGAYGTFDTIEIGGLDYNSRTPQPSVDQITGEPGYRFGGWDPTAAPTVTENKTYSAIWIPEEATYYKVEFFYEEQGQYPQSPTSYKERTAQTDTVATVTDKDKIPPKGYVLDTVQGILSGTVAGNGSLVLKLYFKQQFKVSYAPGEKGTFDTQIKDGILYGQSTPGFEGTITGEAGYHFAGWSPEVSETVTDHVVYTAQWAANTDTTYRVAYHYQTMGSYTEEPIYSKYRTGTTDDVVRVADEDLQTVRDGYVFDVAASGNVMQEELKGDSTTLLHVYFKQQLYATYHAGLYGAFETYTVDKLDYNANTPQFMGNVDTDENPLGKAGYTFQGWTPSWKETVTGDIVYTAEWAANTDTEYKVELYYQKNGRYPQEAEEYRLYTGTTGMPATVSDNDKQTDRMNYVFDPGAPNQLEGIISGDGSLSLRVYFKQKFTVTYEKGNRGTFAPIIMEDLDYNAETPVPDAGKITGDGGYHFAGWSPLPAPSVTSDRVYTATWIPASATGYRVEFYYENKGSYAQTTESYQIREGVTDTVAAVAESDKAGTEGYVFDTEAENVLSGNVAGDGSLVLKLYFKQQFTVRYEKGAYGAIEDQVYTGLSYGTRTPDFEGELTGQFRCSFTGWSPKVEDTVTGSITYTANWSYPGNNSGDGSDGGGTTTRPGGNGNDASGGPGVTDNTITPDQVPLNALPTDERSQNGGTISIDDNRIPLEALPKTGNRTGMAGVMAVLSGVLMTLYLTLTGRKEDEI